MRIIKLFVFSAVVLFLVVAAISLLLPSHVRISRAINIQAAPLKIWAQVDDMRRWKQWNPFFSQLDSGRIHYVDSINGRPVLMEIAGTSVKWQEIKSDERVAVLQKEGKTSLINGWKCITGPSSGSTTCNGSWTSSYAGTPGKNSPACLSSDPMVRGWSRV